MEENESEHLVYQEYFGIVAASVWLQLIQVHYAIPGHLQILSYFF